MSLRESPASQQQKAQLTALLTEHQEIFSSSKGGTGKCTLIQHHIKTGEHPPLLQCAYQTSPEKREEIDRQVAALLAEGVIKESCSPWALPVVLIKKKNGKCRFCIDYHCLNSITVKDSHPLPRVAPVVTMPDFNIPFKVYTDVSMEAVGAVLAQDRDGLERVVVYASQSLSSPARRCSTFDRELWAIVWAIRQFRHYIGSAAFTIMTDHKPLLGLCGMSIDKDPTGRRARWILERDPYNWIIQHKDGQ